MGGHDAPLWFPLRLDAQGKFQVVEIWKLTSRCRQNTHTTTLNRKAVKQIKYDFLFHKCLFVFSVEPSSSLEKKIKRNKIIKSDINTHQ